jgi:hypothetical protein
MREIRKKERCGEEETTAWSETREHTVGEGG